MSTTTQILFIAFLLIGISSVLSVGGMYLFLIYKHRNVDTIFYFWEKATKTELLILRMGLIGLFLTIIIFLIM